MRIAFDLDDTLISVEFPPEKGFFLLKFLRKEYLRRGTKTLFRELRRQKHEIWIYTSSYRSKGYIGRLFFSYGLRLDGIVNQFVHDEFVGEDVSKFPPAFGIDILVDNSRGVEAEGEAHGFKTIIIEPGDADWTGEVMNKVLATET